MKRRQIKTCLLFIGFSASLYSASRLVEPLIALSQSMRGMDPLGAGGLKGLDLGAVREAMALTGQEGQAGAPHSIEQLLNGVPGLPGTDAKNDQTTSGPEAIELRDVRADLDPEEARRWSESAVALHTAGRLDEAISAYLEALEDAPDDAGLRSNLAVAYFQNGQYDRAWEQVDLGRALGREPDERFIRALSAKSPAPTSASGDRRP